jgi:hypothetical protein
MTNLKIGRKASQRLVRIGLDAFKYELELIQLRFLLQRTSFFAVPGGHVRSAAARIVHSEWIQTKYAHHLPHLLRCLSGPQRDFCWGCERVVEDGRRRRGVGEFHDEAIVRFLLDRRRRGVIARREAWRPCILNCV